MDPGNAKAPTGANENDACPHERVDSRTSRKKSDAEAIRHALSSPFDDSADFDRVLDAIDSGYLDKILADEPDLELSADFFAEDADDSFFDGAAVVLRPRPQDRFQVVEDGFFAERIDGGARNEHNEARSTFMAFRWRLAGSDHVIFPETVLREAILIVTEGEITVTAEGHAPKHLTANSEAFWICAGDVTPPRMGAVRASSATPTARGLLLMFSDLGVPLLDDRFAPAPRPPASATTIVRTLALAAPQDSNLWAGLALTPIDPGELRYPHAEAIKLGNIEVFETGEWLSARENRSTDQSRFLFRAVRLPACGGEYDVSLAAHLGAEVIIPAFGDTVCYFARIGRGDEGARRLGEDIAGTDQIGGMRATILSAGGRREDEGVLVIDSHRVLHGFRAAGADAGLLMFGVSSVQQESGWLEHAGEVERAATARA